jgi:ribosomal protein L16 Arg81 hydroxylase
MILRDAQEIVSGLLSPVSYDTFFDEHVSKKPLALVNECNGHRNSLVGEDPKAAILRHYDRYAQTLTCHMRAPKGPPPSPRAVESADAFYRLIGEYHERGYTVRIPEVTDLSPELNRITRALEFLMGNPVGVVVFWSADEAEAPVHHDEIDVIVLQLYGTKKWFISKNEPTLPNKWKSLGEKEPPLGEHHIIDVGPGDLLYVPRGTPHTVKSTGESIHLAIGFVPVTAREAIAAALDYLSDFDRPLRGNLGKRADSYTRNMDARTILEQIRTGVAKLNQYCQSDAFIRDALAHRHSVMLQDLEKLPRPTSHANLTIDSKVRHNPLAMARLNVTPDILDFRQPGEQILIHLSVEQQLRFIKDTSEFYVRDIPGDIGNDIRLALAGRLVASGYLEPAM